MPRPKWMSGMPVESMRVARGTSSPIRGQREMPDGVVEPMYAAATIVAEYRRRQTVLRSASTRPAGQIVTVTGVLVPPQEIRARERLFASIRRGSASAAAELWATRRAWIVVGAQSPSEARRG